MEATGPESPDSRGFPLPGTTGAGLSWDNGTRHSVTLPEPLPALHVFLPVAYAAICAVRLTGNAATICVILRAPRMKTVTHAFTLNLAIATTLHTGAAHQHRRARAAALALWGAALRAGAGHRPLQHLLQRLLPGRCEHGPTWWCRPRCGPAARPGTLSTGLRSPACAPGWVSLSRCCPSSPSPESTAMSYRSQAAG